MESGAELRALRALREIYACSTTVDIREAIDFVVFVRSNLV